MTRFRVVVALALSFGFHLLLVLGFWMVTHLKGSSPLAGGGRGGGGGEVRVDLFRESGSILNKDKSQRPLTSPSAIPAPVGEGFGTQEGSGVGAGAGVGSGDEGSDPVLAEIRSRIERVKRFPELAKRMNLQGKALVRFQINSEGRPKDILLKKSSEHSLLDEEALATIRRAAPFPVYPAPLEVWIRFE